MATEENKEAQTEAEEKNSAVKNIIQIVEDENSYINSAKERMNDVIDTFLTNAENSVALNDFSLIFKSVTVWIKFRPRKLGQYVEIIKERSTADSIQRLQAALKNEYLEAKDVKFAITNIEKVEEKFTAVLIYSRLESEKKIGGKLFRYDSQEAKDVHQGLIRRVKKNFHVEI